MQERCKGAWVVGQQPEGGRGGDEEPPVRCCGTQGTGAYPEYVGLNEGRQEKCEGERFLDEGHFTRIIAREITHN